jgi:hypothetical protein
MIKYIKVLSCDDCPYREGKYCHHNEDPGFIACDELNDKFPISCKLEGNKCKKIDKDTACATMIINLILLVSGIVLLSYTHNWQFGVGLGSLLMYHRK